MKPLADCRLYTFVDTGCLRGRSAAEVARQLCEGGADIIQLRAKGLERDDVARLGREVLPVARMFDVGLVVNDHCDVAKELGADLCHLGQEDFFDSAGACGARAAGQPFGLSTHSPAQARRAVAAAPAYIAVGPVYVTPTKPQAPPVTLEYVRWAAENVEIPWFAIGGINQANLEDVLRVGATRLCVVSAILNAPDVAAACREFKRRICAG